RYSEWAGIGRIPQVDVDPFGQVMVVLAMQAAGAPKITVNNVEQDEQRFQNVIDQWSVSTLALSPSYGLEGDLYSFIAPGAPSFDSLGNPLQGLLYSYDPDGYVLRREGLKKVLGMPPRPDDDLLHFVARMRGQVFLHQWDRALASAQQAIDAA